MNEPYMYKAFGMDIRSEFEIAQIPAAQDRENADVRIVKKDLGEYSIGSGYCSVNQKQTLFSLELGGKFRVTNGDCIEVDPAADCSDSLLGAFIMGSGMGAVLHQRGFMPLHGSCVTDGEGAVLIVGDSGAGKSTLAAEFLSHGWKLITDDVAAVYNVESEPMVQASYPSQKLWQDAMDRYNKHDDDIHSLYVRDDREKFGVNVLSSFYDGCCPLKMIIRLIASDAPCSIAPIEPMVQIDQLMRNTYRSYMIAPKNRERHFRRCAALAQKVPMVLLTRQNGVSCADVLYDMITNFNGEMNHE